MENKEINITAQQLRNMQYKKLLFEIYRDYTDWKKSLSGGSKVQTRFVQNYFLDLLGEVLEGFIQYESYEKKFENQSKLLAELRKELDEKDKKLAKISSSLQNLTSEKRKKDPQARFMD